MPSYLQVRDLTIRFGDFVALRDVSLTLERHRIHAVCGQNGAGKTSFARACAGLVPSATGRLLVDGQPLPFGQVAAARAAGVALVHQSFALPPSFTVAEAMEFGLPGHTTRLFSRRALERRWTPHLTS